MAEERNFRKVRRGYVVSDKMDKTISVELEQPFDPPRFTARLCAPLVRSRSMMNTTRLTLATLVSIMETRPPEQDQAFGVSIALSSALSK